jgi:nucleoside phosphorylase/transcription elongation GreA/GreB family factor/predicted negative regulator of RcsB-dependent stress response
MANAVIATLARYKPRYILLVGIAGGFPLDKQTRGDVAISSVIYDYEYGKVAEEFQPRVDFTYRVDSTLETSSISLDARDRSWADFDQDLRPTGHEGVPKVRTGAVASGSKVIDNASNAFFAKVLKQWSRLLAVEMEGAGAASAIEAAHAARKSVGFMMVRGISDMPKSGSDPQVSAESDEGNKAERDLWKRYAAAVAANFTIHWIAHGWPIQPRRTRRSTASRPPEEDDDPPPADAPAPLAAATNVTPAASASSPDSSIWLGFLGAVSHLEVPADFSRAAPELIRMVLAAASGQLERSNQPASSAADAELELIKAKIDGHELEVAESKLNEMERRADDRMEPAQWYQLKNLRARIHIDRWEWEKAGRILIDAKRYMPATERARINEVLGYELLGDRAKAYALASDLRSEFPHSVKLVTILLRTAPPTVAFEGLEEAAEPFTKDDEEINLALAHRALVEDRYGDAAAAALKATQIDLNSPHAWFVLGEARHMAGYRSGQSRRKELLSEAEQHYSRAVELAQAQKMPGLEAAIRFTRGKVRHLLGDRRTESDYIRAIELGRPDQEIRTEYAGLLVELGRYDEALRELDMDPREPTGNRLFYEAAARYERNFGDDRERAVDLLRKVIGSPPCERWPDAHVLLVQWATENKTHGAARAAINSTELRRSHPLVYHTLQGWLLDSEGKKDEAKAELREALKAPFDSATRSHLFLLAQALVSVEEHEFALPVLEKCYRQGVFDQECKALLDCARRLERHDVLVSVCRELRKEGVADPRVVQTEIRLLQMYDPHAALQVAQEHLAAHPEDRVVTLWQSALALRLDRKDLVVGDLTRLPLVKDVTPEGAGLVINVLRETGQPAAALGYAYDALRAHFDREFAHGQYLAHYLILSKKLPELRNILSVTPGMAVRYQEEHEGQDRWVILEDGSGPDLARNELSPEHPMAAALAGHEAGDVVIVSDSEIQQRAITIRGVCHKYVYRFWDCANQYQVRFPGGSAVQLIHVGNEDKVDPTAIVKSLKGRRGYIEQLDGHYRKGSLPFPTYVEMTGCDEFVAWGHLVSTATLGFRCFDGDYGGLREGMDLARSSKTIVLDLMALFVIAQLGLLRILKNATRAFVVSRGTHDRLQTILEKAGERELSGDIMGLTEGDQLALVSPAPWLHEKQAAFLSNLVGAVTDSCQVRPCPQALSLPPKQRTDLIAALGRHTLESLLLAKEDGAVLWTDDLLIGVLGRSDFQTRRVWVQAVLFALMQEGVVTQREYEEAVAKLVGWHYLGIHFNEEILVTAAELAEWQMDRWPVAAFMHYLGQPEMDAGGRLRIAAQSIRSVWRRALPDHTRRGFLSALLSGLGSVQLVRHLYQAIPGLFTVDVFSADEVQGLILMWLRLPNGRILRP